VKQNEKPLPNLTYITNATSSEESPSSDNSVTGNEIEGNLINEILREDNVDMEEETKLETEYLNHNGSPITLQRPHQSVTPVKQVVQALMSANQ
jgi:hypothetical protein